MTLPISRDLTFIAGTSQIPAATMNRIQDSIIAGVRGMYFGDGSDGNVTLTGVSAPPSGMAGPSGGVYNMSRDFYAENLTLNGTAVLNPNGYRLFVRGTLTIGASNLISNPAFGGITTTGGIAAATGSLLGGTAGGAGGTSGVPAGVAGANASNAIGGAGGLGGLGDSTGANVAGGAGGTSTAPVAGRGGYRSIATAQTGQIFGVTAGASVVTALTGGAGGGGGHYGNDGVSGSSNGGGGGGGGGLVAVCATELVLAGAIEAKGGIGAAATLATGTGYAGGGGGGGGGGVIFLVYGSRSGAGTTSVSGGAGGAAHAGGGAGITGAAGVLIEVNVGG